MVEAFLNGDTKKAANLQLLTKPITDAVFMEVNPIPIKAAMNLMGMSVGSLRMPLIEMSEPGQVLLKEEMKKIGLL